ncbi:MAG: hypothetical protein IJM37_11340 [Lachnospiraceae bacterium]|nr:hypothetical protein [Lachnospiraceae bacterium]
MNRIKALAVIEFAILISLGSVITKIDYFWIAGLVVGFVGLIMAFTNEEENES